MTLDPRNLALQGVGGGPLQVALQGLLPLEETPAEPPAFAGGVGRRPRPSTRKAPARRDRDDDVLLFLLR